MIVDTGVLLAAVDRKDRYHEPCRDLVLSARGDIVVPVPVLVELEYLVTRRLPRGAWLEIAQDLASEAFTLHPLDGAGLLDAAHLQARYADVRLGLVDAAVFVTCVALDERQLATLDRRHFTILRLPDGGALDLVPTV